MATELEDDEVVEAQFAIRAYTSYEEPSVPVEPTPDEDLPPQEEIPTINDSGSITIENPNGSLSDIVGDTTPTDTPTEVVENPQTGMISGISIVIVLAIIGIVIYYKKKNKIFKI